MTDTQQRAVVAGFLHVLTTSPELYADFQKIESNPQAVGEFITKTMNLKSQPGATDLKNMAAYADEQLADHVEKLGAAGGVPKQCGNMFGLEHEDE